MLYYYIAKMGQANFDPTRNAKNTPFQIPSFLTEAIFVNKVIRREIAIILLKIFYRNN